MHYSQKRNFFGFWKRQIIKVLHCIFSFYAHFTDIKKIERFYFCINSIS